MLSFNVSFHNACQEACPYFDLFRTITLSILQILPYLLSRKPIEVFRAYPLMLSRTPFGFVS